MFSVDEDIFEFVEFITLLDKSVIPLQLLLLDDLLQIVMQTLEVVDETLDKVFDTMLRLVDAICLFLGILLVVTFLFVGVWHDLEPDVDDGNGEGDWEIEHEDG